MKVQLKLWIVALAISAALSGCASVPGPFNGLGSDPMSMLIVYRTDTEPLTKAQYDLVTKIAQRMGVQLDWQMSSAAESAATTGGAYLVSGALGGGTQPLFFQGARFGPAAGYTGAVYALGGVVNGLTSASYANVHSLSAMVEVALRDEERAGERDLMRVHAVGSFIRSKNRTGEPADELKKRMPDWTGPETGKPVAQAAAPTN